MKRCTALLTLALMTLGLLAGPAAAVNQAGVFTGLAAIGEDIPGGCTKAGGVAPAGAGLTVPQPKDADNTITGGDPAKDRKFRLTGAVTNIDLTVVPTVQQGTLDLCGNITSVAGIGPRCGMSKGYNGKGFILFDTRPDIKLDGVGWKASVGGTLPIIGRAWDIVGGAKTKKGTLTGVVQAQGGAGCITTNKGAGSTEFNVVGEFEVIQGAPVDDWNDVTGTVDVPIIGPTDLEPKNDGPSSATNPWGDKPKKKAPKTA